MPSILTGYSYDIFITYRQKDNKYDKWVTEFVSNLRKELEATFKHDVSIYFDENPHDGLLEMHKVDQSLEGKLRSLILIPIISQTYCDPASFAWKNEFIAFNKLVVADKFGRDIRLENGNVISRILPVRIHDLDEADKRLLATELGGPLRPIDFIYRSPGVNRPLRSNEEHPDENLNHTIYRDQINKVANSVKDIIQRLINKDSAGSAAQPASPVDVTLTPPLAAKIPRGNRKFNLSPKITRRGWVWLLVGVVLALAVITFPWKQEGGQLVKSSTVIRATIDLADRPIEFIGQATLGIGRRSLSISSDGKQIAFIGRHRNSSKIFLRNIDDFRVNEVPSSERAYNPVFSGDGKHLLYFEEDKVWRTGIDGASRVSLAELADPWDATWGGTNEVFISSNQGSRLYKISDDVQLVSIDTVAAQRYRSLQRIAGTPYLLFSGEVAGLRDLRTGTELMVPIVGSNIRYVPTGHLVYVNGSSLMAIAFDLDALAVRSDPVEVVSGLRIEQTGTAQFDFSENGTLVFAEGADARVGTMVYHDINTGVVDSLATPLRTYGQFSLSRDSKRIAVAERHNGRDVFVYEVRSGKSQRITTDGVSSRPIWHPDNRRLFYVREEDAYVVEPDKNDKPKLFMKNASVQSFSGDGEMIVIRRGSNLFRRTMQDSTLELLAERKAFGSISPNGAFLTYTSTETGQSHIYLEPVPHTGQRWQVSMQGGSEESKWSSDGTKLYYRCGQKWYVVPVTFRPELQVGVGTVIVDENYVNVPGFSYDIAASGSKLLLVKGLQKEGPKQIRIVHGWFDELKRLVPATK